VRAGTVTDLFDGSVWQGIGNDDASRLIRENHYTRSVPSGKSHWFHFAGAIVVFSIPANNNISRFFFGVPNVVWELSRLWAPDGHAPNLLTQAISVAVKMFRKAQPTVIALVSYADPNAGHTGGIYRASSWTYTGRSEENRCYRSLDGTLVSRRKIHSGETGLRKSEIEALGFTEVRLAGKHRYAHGLTRAAKKVIAAKAVKWAETPPSEKPRQRH